MEYYWHVIEGSMEFIWYDESDDIKLFDIFVISGGLYEKTRFALKPYFYYFSATEYNWHIIEGLMEFKW